uniref:Uncharacterized protein n=1 Tax=Micrurus corallinus TaxID=54390 RepID=A0A2D4FKP0_MICCO
MSCSLFKLWINDPAQRKRSALKKECVIICRKASEGWFRPTIVIIKPSWLVVDIAMIFLISKWVVAEAAANIVVVAPNIRQIAIIVLLSCSVGLRRINKKMPATTIVLECSRAETGVGPSMAEGSQG